MWSTAREQEVQGGHCHAPVWPVSELLLAFEGEGFERGVLFAVEGLEGGPSCGRS